MLSFKRSISSVVVLSACFFNAGCQSTGINDYSVKNAEQSLFIQAGKDIKLEDANRRKWDNAVIADLDQDGYLDLLLTDHGFSIKVYWNNKGKFGEGTDILMGDTHGIAVGDFNQDGEMDILVSRGGGSGENARNAKLFHVKNKRKIVAGNEFNEPLRKMRGRTSKFFDGDNDGDLDLLLFGFPGNQKEKDIPSYVYKNDGKGQLVLETQLPKTYRDGQKMLVTDFNNDGISDFMLYGDKHIKAFKGNGDLTFKDVTTSVIGKKINDVTSVSEIDYDNDGDFDLFLTRGSELTAGDTFFDPNTSSFAFYTKRGKFSFGPFDIGHVLNLKNYQSGWPDQSIYIGESAYEYEHKSEYHSGQDIKLISSNALGWPDKLDKKGLYVGYIGNGQWRIAGNTWSPTTGVIQGVKSYPAYEHLEGLTAVLLKNNQGKFVDVSAKAGLGLKEHTSSAAVGDFDNNGYQDIFVLRRGNLATENKQLLFMNQGDNTFLQNDKHSIVSEELGAIGMAAEFFDYNIDGKVDLIYANERGKWHLFKNNLTLSKNTNYVNIHVGRSPKNNTASIGALVTVSACEQSHISRIGNSSSAYSQSLNNLVHIGLGACDTVDDITVRWSNRETVKQKAKVNTLVNIGN